MQREFCVVEQEDEYGEIILSLAAFEVCVRVSVCIWGVHAITTTELTVEQQGGRRRRHNSSSDPDAAAVVAMWRLCQHLTPAVGLQAFFCNQMPLHFHEWDELLLQQQPLACVWCASVVSSPKCTRV